MEAAIIQSASRMNHSILPFRWESGNLGDMIKASSWKIGERILTDRNPWRRAVHILLLLQKHRRKYWNDALANMTGASLAAAAILMKLARTEEPFAAVGFSLGGRVLLSALCAALRDLRRLNRAVFAGAAISSPAFSAIPPALLKSRRIVNVYSGYDDVLERLYPGAHGCDDAAGVAPVRRAGIKNVRVNTGHLSYPNLATKLVRLATETELLGSRTRSA